MDLADLGLLIMNNSCSNPSIEHHGYNEYVIELHCNTITVTAKCINYDNEEWDILKAEMVDS